MNVAQLEDLPYVWPIREQTPFLDAKALMVANFERAYLARLMLRTGGNVSWAAREARIARHHLRDLLRKHGLYRPATE